MSCSRFFVGSLLIATAVACSAQGEDADVGSANSELQVPDVGFLGPIGNGETKNDRFSGAPKHRAYGFLAKGGDEITARVKALNGNAVGFLTDANHEVLAENDNADGTLDAKVSYTVPAGSPEREYRIVFRDVAKPDMNYSVRVSVRNPATACNPSAEPYRVYKYQPLVCPNVRWDCETWQFPFTNACGCGCEDIP